MTNKVHPLFSLLLTYSVVAAAGIILGLNSSACFVAVLPCLVIYFLFLYHPKDSRHAS